jgi:hypothetical protein
MQLALERVSGLAAGSAVGLGENCAVIISDKDEIGTKYAFPSESCRPSGRSLNFKGRTVDFRLNHL